MLLYYIIYNMDTDTVMDTNMTKFITFGCWNNLK